MDMKLYIRHKLTAYHLRELIQQRRGKRQNHLAICHCGWKCRMLRTGPKDILRQMRCITGHNWGEWWDVEVGGVYQNDDGEWICEIDEGNGVTISRDRQCKKCYKVDSVSTGR
jgi:hypothetical protein